MAETTVPSSRDSEAQQLRAELKQWENVWAKEHGGKKPGREDIKQNPEIAQKYKAYNKLRDILSGKTAAPAPAPAKDDPKPRKRKSPEQEPPTQTPSKRARPAQTPSKVRHDDALAPAVTPSLSRRLFSPAVPTSIGPTPQRDGKVLGLFDLLSGRDAETPSRRPDDVAGADVSAKKIQATPSKQTSLDPESAFKLGRTPVSSSKRYMLDSFMTPLKSRDGNAGSKTPTSVSKLQFATPAFLRRAPMPTVDEGGEFVSPQPIRLPRKPLVRGLSSVVASLRKLEEEQLDEDLEILHELENESMAPRPKPKPKLAGDAENVLVEDSQAQNRLLGGFDDEARYDSPPEEAVGREGNPLRVYKKKGQKRTTRRANMKPVRSKRPEEAADNGEEGSDDENDAVPETQLDAAKQVGDDPALPSGSEFEESEAEEAKKRQTGKKKTTDKKTAKTAKTAEGGEGKIKRAARKVNELAHANFKRLKLRNNGAKGGPGHNSRFRRRR